MQSSRATIAVLVIGVGLTLAVAKWGDPEVAVLIVLVTFVAAVATSWKEARSAAPALRSALPAALGDTRTYTPVIGGTAFGAVFIEIGRERLVLCLFPVANAQAEEELAKAKPPGPGLEAFQALLDLLPTHRDARVNLVSALCALDRKADAREHLEQLEDTELSLEILAQLQDQCA